MRILISGLRPLPDIFLHFLNFLFCYPLVFLRFIHGVMTLFPGLFQRTLADGSTVYEVSARFGGRMRRHRLTATTKTDAVAEARDEMAEEWIAGDGTRRARTCRRRPAGGRRISGAARARFSHRRNPSPTARGVPQAISQNAPESVGFRAGSGAVADVIVSE